MSMKYHPDKNKSEEAPKMFLLIQKCKEILLDEAKRKQFDDKLSATLKRTMYESERMSTMDATRKRLREEFERKLSAENNQKSNNNINTANNASRSNNKNENYNSKINKIREESRNRIYEANNTAMNNAFEHQHQRETEQIQKQAACEIKVKWKLSGVSESDDSLYSKFKLFGNIKKIELHKTKGNVANIIFDNEESVQKAVSFYENSVDYRVSSVVEDKRSKIYTFNYNKDGTRPTDNVNSTNTNTNNDSNINSNDILMQKIIHGHPIANSYNELILLESSILKEIEAWMDM